MKMVPVITLLSFLIGCATTSKKDTSYYYDSSYFMWSQYNWSYQHLKNNFQVKPPQVVLPQPPQIQSLQYQLGNNYNPQWETGNTSQRNYNTNQIMMDDLRRQNIQDFQRFTPIQIQVPQYQLPQISPVQYQFR